MKFPIAVSFAVNLPARPSVAAWTSDLVAAASWTLVNSVLVAYVLITSTEFALVSTTDLTELIALSV